MATNSSAPKILLAKPSAASFPSKFGRGAVEDESAPHRSRLAPVGTLNLLSDSWDFHIDRFLPFLTENTDFTVVGVIGPPGVGKSTIMNELYGFDGTSPGMLPPFATQSEETRAMARHCTIGIEPRVSSERLILLDTQPVFSPSVLAEMMRPDGSSAVPVLSGELISAELAHEIMSIQLGVLLSSICHILLVVSGGVHDNKMWHLMSTVDLLKHNIHDPSSMTTTHSQSSNLGPEKDVKDKVQEGHEYMATPVFVQMSLQDRDLTLSNIAQLKEALAQHFSSSSFMRRNKGNMASDTSCSSKVDATDVLSLFVIPSRNQDDSSKARFASYDNMLCKLRDKVLSMKCPSFTKNVSERDWLKNSAKVWEVVKASPIIQEYSRTLLDAGFFRR